MKISTKLLCCLLLMVLAFPCTVSAENTKVYVQGAQVTVYSSYDTSSQVLGVLNLGQSVTMTASKNGWARVRTAGGAVGYCRADALTKNDVNRYSETLFAVQDGALVYRAAADDAEVLGRLALNGTVIGVAISADKTWCRVKKGGEYGYMHMTDVSRKKVPVVDVEGTAEGAADIMYAADTCVNIYEKPDALSATVGMLSFGEDITVTGENGTFIMVKQASGKSGYCVANELTKKDPNVYCRTIYVSAAEAGLYLSATEKSEEMALLRRGDEVTVLAKSGDWCRVMKGSLTGYMHMSDVSGAAPADAAKGYVVCAKTDVHRSADKNSTIEESLFLGEEVLVYSSDKTWAYVTTPTAGCGYVLVKDLSKTDVNKYTETVYVKNASAVLYGGADEGAEKLATLSVGDKLTGIAISADKKWCRVKTNDRTGYMLMKDVTQKDISRGTKVWAKDTLVKLYASASEKSEMLDTASFGTELNMLTWSGNWAMIKLESGTVVYAKISGLSKKNVNTANMTRYVNAAAVNVYEKADTGSVVVTALTLNSSVAVKAVSADKSWYRVKLSTGYGYVRASGVSDRKLTSKTTVYVKVKTAPVYKSNSASSYTVGSLAFGQSIPMLAYRDGWALVSDGSMNGYIQTKDLTKTDPNKLNYTCYAQTGSVTVRSLPDQTSVAVTTLSLNEKVVCVMFSPDGNWCRVKAGKKYGYVPKNQLGMEEAQSSTVYVTDDTVKIYTTADELGNVMGTMSYGENLILLSSSDGWAYVENIAGNRGYCLTGSIDKTDPNIISKVGYIKTNDTPVYAKPLTSSSVLGKMKKNSSLTVVAMTKSGEWCRVRSSSGAYGYVKTDSISASQENDDNKKDNTASYSTSMQGLLSLALSKKDCKYVYATQGPNTFDCSGFTNYLYRTIYNITLSRSAYGQGYQTKYPIIEKISDLKPGDVLCFNTNADDDDYSDHVGLYLGEGQFIHASYTAGKVIISNMTSYYKSVFFHAFRPVSQ